VRADADWTQSLPRLLRQAAAAVAVADAAAVWPTVGASPHWTRAVERPEGAEPGEIELAPTGVTAWNGQSSNRERDDMQARSDGRHVPADDEAAAVAVAVVVVASPACTSVAVRR